VGKTLTFAREGRLVLKGLSKGQKVEIRWTERNQDTGKVASYVGGQKRSAATEFNCHDNVSNETAPCPRSPSPLCSCPFSQLLLHKISHLF